MEFLGRRAEVGEDRIEIDLGGVPALERRLDEEVVEHGLAVGPPGEQIAAAAERAEHRLGDARRAKRGQCGVEGVAAVLQNLPSGRGGRRMAAGDRALGAHRGLRSRPNSAVDLLGVVPAMPGWTGKARGSGLADAAPGGPFMV